MKSVSNFNQALQGLQQQLVRWLKLYTHTHNTRPKQAQQITALLKIIQANTSAKPFQIFIKNHDGKTYTLDIQVTDNISAIKTSIKDKIGIPSAEQQLIYQGRPLEDDQTIQDQQIKRNSTLYLNLRLRGGVRLWEILIELDYADFHDFIMVYVMPHFNDDATQVVEFLQNAHQLGQNPIEAFEAYLQNENLSEEDLNDSATEQSSSEEELFFMDDSAEDDSWDEDLNDPAIDIEEEQESNEFEEEELDEQHNQEHLLGMDEIDDFWNTESSDDDLILQ